MRYALKLSEDNRILSATYEKYATPDMPIVDELPDGDISEYLYIDGEYVYSPVPEPKLLASDNYFENEIFTENGEMYIATQTIIRGEEIVPYINCVPTSIIEQLNKSEEE